MRVFFTALIEFFFGVGPDLYRPTETLRVDDIIQAPKFVVPTQLGTVHHAHRLHLTCNPTALPLPLTPGYPREQQIERRTGPNRVLITIQFCDPALS